MKRHSQPGKRFSLWQGTIAGFILCLWSLPVGGQVRNEPAASRLLEEDYQRVIQENERLKEALEATRTELSTLKRWLKRPERAVEYRGAITRLTRAIEAQPTDAALYQRRGMAHRHLGEYAKAIEDLDRAIELAGSDANSYNERGTAHFLDRNWAQARQDFSRAIVLDPGLAAAYHNRAVIARKEGDYRLAAKDLRTAQSLGVEQAEQTIAAIRGEVSAIQRRLNQLGFAAGPVDGIAGSQTEAAIRELQKSAGLEPTGKVDLATRVALRAVPRRASATAPAQQPRLLEKPELGYPSLARDRGWEGTVTLQIELLANGRVGRVDVVKSSGHRVLDESAVENVRQWRHQPLVKDGRPVTRKIYFDIEFALDGKGRGKTPDTR